MDNQDAMAKAIDKAVNQIIKITNDYPATTDTASRILLAATLAEINKNLDELTTIICLSR